MRKQFALMATRDMAAVMDFLRQENNGDSKAGKPPRANLNKLCILGADMGAAVALEFARLDWSVTPQFLGAWQKGGFTKALVLLSPERSLHGINVKPALGNKDVHGRLSVLLMVGKEANGPFGEAKKMNSIFEKYHLPPPPDKKELKTLFFVQLDTKLQGTNLLDEKLGAAEKYIEPFISRRLVKAEEAKSYKWAKLRRDPYVAEKGE